jgi:hypothetical protein
MAKYDLYRLLVLLLGCTIIVSLFTKLSLSSDKPFSRRKLSATLVSVVLITGMLVYLPFENIFLSFDSPEKVFAYVRTGVVQELLFGRDSCLVVYEDSSGNNASLIIPKTGSGFSIPNPFTTKNVSASLQGSHVWRVLQTRNTQDYYVVGLTYPAESMVQVIRGNSLQSHLEVTRRIESGSFFIALERLTHEDYLLIEDNKFQIMEM